MALVQLGKGQGRKGSWVTKNKRLAIIYDIIHTGEAIIHYVNEDGETESEEVVNLGQLERVTDFFILPESRRP